MRILLLGASGLLGRATLERLAAGANAVTALFHRTSPDEKDLPGCDAQQGDLLDLEWFSSVVEACRPEIIVHCAVHIFTTTDVVERSRAFDLNVRFNAFLSVIARRFAVSRIVNGSSASVYAPGEALIGEGTPPRPLDFYGLTKYLGEEALLRQGGVQIINLRFCGLFGPHRKSGAVYRFCRAARGEGEIRVPDDPARFQFLSSSDAAEAIWAACSLPDRTSGTYNIASRETVTLEQLAWMIAGAGGGTATVQLEHRAVVPMPLLDTTRAQRELGWEPTPLMTSLERFSTCV